MTTSQDRRERALLPWIPVLVAAISVLVGIWTWQKNASAARVQQDYERREQHYVRLVSSLSGFQVGGGASDKAEFLAQLDQCWLYCSDDVIRAAYRFVATVEEGAVANDAGRNAAVGELVAAIRKDLIRRQPVLSTDLGPRDYRILKVK